MQAVALAAGLVLFALLVIHATGSVDHPGPAVMYQPQTRDTDTPPAAWRQLFADLRKEGFETLVLQWTRHGEEDFGGAGGWLDSVADHAADAGLAVRIGLYWDPDWSHRLTDGHTRLEAYLQATFAGSHRQSEVWSHWQDRDAFAGWYLPVELPDRTFSDQEARQSLRDALAELRRDLDAPLAVSSYFQGVQSPTAYARWLSGLRGTGTHIWVQDGAGASTLSRTTRTRYLDALPCSLGVIEEHFLRISEPDEDFRAIPVHRGNNGPTAVQDCHARTVFALRYLRPATGILQFQP